MVFLLTHPLVSKQRANLLNEECFEKGLELNLSLILGENKVILNELEDVLGFFPAYGERDLFTLVEGDYGVFVEGWIDYVAKDDYVQEREKTNELVKVCQVWNMVWKV